MVSRMGSDIVGTEAPRRRCGQGAACTVCPTRCLDNEAMHGGHQLVVLWRYISSWYRCCSLWFFFW